MDNNDDNDNYSSSRCWMGNMSIGPTILRCVKCFQFWVKRSPILALWVENPILCHHLHLPIYHRPYHIKIGSGTFYFSFYLVNNWSFLLRTFLYFNRCAMKFETHCFERWSCAASAGSANQVCNLIWCQLFDTKLENIGAQRHLSELTQN